jgi:putative transposase
MTAGLAVSALRNAIALRSPAGTVVVHSDRGTRAIHRRHGPGGLRPAGHPPVHGPPGSALDNAVIESWHSTLEFELRALQHFTTKAQARARIPAWIDEYNHHRRDSALGMKSPVDYEKTLQAGTAA